MKIFLLAALLSTAFVAAPAAAPDGDPIEGARVAAELRAMHPAEEVRWFGVFKQKQPDGLRLSIPVTCDIFLETNRWLATYVTQAGSDRPAEKLVIVRYHDGRTDYLHWTADGEGTFPVEPVRLTGAAAAVPFAGTDFLLSDFGLEFLRWPTQLLQPGEMRRSTPCYVLDSINPKPDAGYVRVRSWISKEHMGLLIAEAIGPDGRTHKEFSAGSFARDASGNYQLKSMEMRTRGGGWTKLEFDLDHEP